MVAELVVTRLGIEVRLAGGHEFAAVFKGDSVLRAAACHEQKNTRGQQESETGDGHVILGIVHDIKLFATTRNRR
jgi:hypothetical protein